MKRRADILVVEQGLVNSREKAKRLIMSGEVLAGSQRIEKPGELIDVDKELRLKSIPPKYVSRGGYKLEKAISYFNLDLKDKICMDIGASTGGFTHCMLLNGAKKVYAIDVGTNQLDYSLRTDNRVVSIEKTNIRYFDKNLIEDNIDFISIDVSFISLELVLPIASNILSDSGKIVALIKPQFEAGKDKVGKKGVIKDKKVHREVVEKIIEFSKNLGLCVGDLTISPITGTTGNVEFLILLQKKEDNVCDYNIEEVVGV